MIEELYNSILEKKKLRENLIELRSLMGEESELTALKELLKGDISVFLELLEHEDPKVRKNATRVLGDLREQSAAEAIMAAYRKEDKFFVKASYLISMGKLDYEPYLDELEETMNELSKADVNETQKKHIREEIKEIKRLLVDKKGIDMHPFRGLQEDAQVILTTNRKHREVTESQLREYKRSLIPAGVKIITNDINPLLAIRTFDEMLFPIVCEEKLPKDINKIAQNLERSNLVGFLHQIHRGKLPFYFRLDIRSTMTLQERSKFARKLASAIEDASERRLLNATTGYEVEIRLMENRDGNFHPYLKLYTVQDVRFSYRKNHVAASIKPFQAATMMELARPFMKENAQVLDPFCGVGTMLVERDKVSQIRNGYGTDVFGEAIEGARKNSEIAGHHFNFINRNFFSFEHEYLFDEIVTNMPARGSGSKDELDQLYHNFFKRSGEFLRPGGIIIMHSLEPGFVKKQLRLQINYKLLQEYCMDEKTGAFLFIIESKG